MYVEGVREFGRAWVRTIPSSSFALKARFDYVDFDTQLPRQTAGQVAWV